MDELGTNIYVWSLKWLSLNETIIEVLKNYQYRILNAYKCFEWFILE